MKSRGENLIRTRRNRRGFTLIEMLIVIIILGILAMVIIPQITVSTDDAKVSTIKTNLTGMRSAIEIYYAQHNMTYPGVRDTTGAADATDLNTVASTIAQLTQFSDVTGKTSGTKTTAYPFGPYIKGGALPANPFNNLDTLANDLAVVDITAARTTSGTTGWKYLPKLGVIFANDGGTSGTTLHRDY